MAAYIDTSIALRLILEDPGSAGVRAWWRASRMAGEDLYSSKLLQVEMARVLQREGLSLALSMPVLSALWLIDIDDDVIRTASSISTGQHLRSLDAIHVGTASLLAPDGIAVVTHDKRMRTVAEALGLTVIDPAE
ncbi:MAG: type II toxin-antitoxin system VapC family toxin [Nocardioides sp.]|nr:type II toxin-antitoxin system VapC family toxin [Nocardioides sp.]